MKRIVFGLWFIVYGLLQIAYGQEQIELRTYYPAPYGAYRILSVGPHTVPPDPNEIPLVTLMRIGVDTIPATNYVHGFLEVGGACQDSSGGRIGIYSSINKDIRGNRYAIYANVTNNNNLEGDLYGIRSLASTTAINTRETVYGGFFNANTSGATADVYMDTVYGIYSTATYPSTNRGRAYGGYFSGGTSAIYAERGSVNDLDPTIEIFNDTVPVWPITPAIRISYDIAENAVRFGKGIDIACKGTGIEIDNYLTAPAGDTIAGGGVIYGININRVRRHSTSADDLYGIRINNVKQNNVPIGETGTAECIGIHINDIGNSSDPQSDVYGIKVDNLNAGGTCEKWAGHFAGKIGITYNSNYGRNGLVLKGSSDASNWTITRSSSHLRFYYGNITSDMPENIGLKMYLHYNGNLYLDGTLSQNAWDFAEMMKFKEDVLTLEPGDVVCINSESSNTLQKSDKPYAKNLSGVISEKPAVLGNQFSKSLEEEEEIDEKKNPFIDIKNNALPVAILGIVKTKVSCENGPIEPGDMLTTSPTPGHAMKAKPIGEINGYPIYPQGCIVGKALEGLKEGKGKILVLVCLM